MNASYKNFPFRLIGCALLLLVVGARTQSVKAVLPAPSVVEAHWRQNTKIFHETFEALFPKAQQLHFWSEDFPYRFKGRNGNSCEIKTSSDQLSFHTLDDLEKLECDAELKKIIKVLGSTEFLEEVLSGEVIKSIASHVTEIKEPRLEIQFIPYFKDAFFNPINKGSLDMTIRLKHFSKEEHFSKEVMQCRFVFDFEKENSVTVLKNCEVSYRAGDDETSMEFLKKTDKLTDFPYSDVQNAKENFPRVYKFLRNRFKSDRAAYRDRKIWLTAENEKKKYEMSMGIPSRDIAHDFVSMTFYKNIVAYIDPHDGSVVFTKPPLSLQEKEQMSSEFIKLYKTSAMLDVLATEDFWEKIFGEKFWNIFKHYYLVDSDECCTISFDIAPCNDGLKISVSLDNFYRGNMKEDAVSFSPNGSIQWEWLRSNYIKFVFFYDPQKDEISHVRFQDRLILNGEIIKCSKIKGGLLEVTAEDKGEPDSFEKVLEKCGNHHTKASDSSHTGVSYPFYNTGGVSYFDYNENMSMCFGYKLFGVDTERCKSQECIGFGFCEESQTSFGSSSTIK